MTAVVAAVLVGWVVLRTRGHAFVIITIAVLLAAQIIATNADRLTNGSDGITLELPFWNADYQNIPFYYIFLVLLVLAVLFSAWIRADEVRHRADRDPRGRGQGGLDRRRHDASSRSSRTPRARSSSASPAASTRTT